MAARSLKGFFAPIKKVGRGVRRGNNALSSGERLRTAATGAPRASEG
jgi:hypothetical protein